MTVAELVDVLLGLPQNLDVEVAVGDEYYDGPVIDAQVMDVYKPPIVVLFGPR